MGIAAATLALSGALVPPAAADERHLHAALDWSQAVGCVDEPSLRAGVEAHLGRAVFDGAPDVRIVGRIARTRAGRDVVLELSSTGGDALGVRTLHVPRAGCRALDRQLVLVISLLIDLREQALAESAPLGPASPAEAPPAVPPPPQP